MVRTAKFLTSDLITKNVLFFMTLMVFMLQGWAKADTLLTGGSYINTINMIRGDSPTPEGGGSIDPSILNGNSLAYLYCVDLAHTVYASGTYTSTIVTNDGTVNGKMINNAGQVAWLLSNFGTSGQGEKAYALQAAIWHVIDPTIALNPDIKLTTATEYSLYDSYLKALGDNTGNVADFLWISPKDSSGSTYQGLVGASPVPEPGSLILLGSGLAGLAGFGRKQLRKKISG